MQQRIRQVEIYRSLILKVMCLSSSSDDCQMELGPLFVSETFLFSGGGGCQWLNFKITLATND